MNQKPHDEKTTPTEVGPERRSYAPPTLRRLGPLVELTSGGSGAVMEAAFMILMTRFP